MVDVDTMRMDFIHACAKRLVKARRENDLKTENFVFDLMRSAFTADAATEFDVPLWQGFRNSQLLA
jgi:hypothetical protein